ncbi:hypothetical protein HOLleu_16080 [Holothuria leucospilota]|uniref:Uncharacterized protein n=1 Tax=Holothuria leucospilota TaxID=206669 RepID=A0A9Q1C5T8_HOLLE|nr:hypothetical protein HOLleu_16080 [Holothuria leucospilota]
MLQVYKFLSERNPLSSCSYLKVQRNSRGRGYCKKLVKCFARLNIRKFNFSHGVFNEWNSLPEWVVNSTSVHCFKVNIDKFFHSVVESNCAWLVWCWLVVCFQLRLYGLQGILWCLSPPLPFNLLCYVSC